VPFVIHPPKSGALTPVAAAATDRALELLNLAAIDPFKDRRLSVRVDTDTFALEEVGLSSYCDGRTRVELVWARPGS